MEPALGALCRAGGWSYAAVWRFHPHHPRLLILGESYCEDEAKTVVEKMLNQVHIVGEGFLVQGYTWWQHQFLNGIKTIAVLPLQLQGLVQFGSIRKVPRSSDFLNQVRDIFDQMKNASRDGSMEYRQSNSLACGQQPVLTSLRSANGILVNNKVNPLQREKLEENIERTESIRSSICSPSNSQRSLNDLTSHGTGNTSMDTHILAMPVNSKSIYELKGFDDNVTNFFQPNVDASSQVQVNSSKVPDSIIASIMSAYKSSNNLHRITKESSDQSMPEYPPYFHTTTNSPNSGIDELCYSSAGFSSSLTTVSANCLQTKSDKLLCKSVSFSSNLRVSEIQENCITPHHVLVHKQSLIPDPGECARLLSPEESFIVQCDSMQLKDTTHFARHTNSTCPESPNRTPEEATAGTSDNDTKECSGNNGLLESIMLDLSTNSFVQDWWDDSVLLAGNVPNLGNMHSESAVELANKQPLPTGERGLPSISAVEQLLGVGVPPPAGHGLLGAEASALAGCVSDYQLPQFPFRDCITAYNAQVPSLASSSYTSGYVQNGSSKATSVPPANISVDDTCSFNTTNSKGSQSNNPEGMKVAKKRSRAGESTRPRPKDRQLIQDRVKELREIVPNGAKCSIDALLERTIKHMLFLQSVTKYAEKIKQADEPKMLCEERGLFLEIADNIRGFGLTILKGLMELRDGKIWARFLVEANREVTRMDIFLSLVQLLEQNNHIRSTEQMAKVMNNGVPPFTDHQRSLLPIPVGIAERLQ
ncbi:Transcription factor LHW [Dichanthelium oligosanthes]|uniref:Transcription factor LHW n=1 Tax=Dichanthelium oligosanthes TaxID=888268 RepID=A0A1E5WF14_9POAL|nr:Transcription factor LHW [Dichanthelium oligosanthes]